MKPDRLPDEQPHTPETNSLNLLLVYRSMLRIVARLDENEYTENNSLLRQTTEVVLDDLADPASGVDTSQG